MTYARHLANMTELVLCKTSYMGLSVRNSLTQRDLLLNIFCFLLWEATNFDHWQAIIKYAYQNVNAVSINYFLVAWRRVVFTASCFQTKTNRSTQLDLFEKTPSFWQWKLHKLYVFFWVIRWRLKFICQRFGRSYPPVKMEQTEVPKRWHINFRRQRIIQKKAYNIQNTAKVWNQESYIFRHPAGDHQVVPMTVYITICVFIRIAWWWYFTERDT
jgi:hypothetical protein